MTKQGLENREQLFINSASMMVLSIVLLLAACAEPAAEITPAPTPTPTPTVVPSIQLSPSAGRPGDLIFVTGEGWQPKDNLLIGLTTTSPNEGAPTSVSLAQAEGDGRFDAGFILPVREPWASARSMLVTVWSLETDDWAQATLLVPAEGPTRVPDPVATPMTAPSPIAVSTLTQTPVTHCVDAASFVADVTIPQDSRLSPGHSFTKVWRVQNTGTCPWTTEFALVWVDGDSLAASGSVPFTSTISPGSAADLSVDLVAPAEPGTYSGGWRLRDAEGELFGPDNGADSALRVRIIVDQPATATPSPTPTATATPAITAWRGEYFDNQDLAGTPDLVRDDAVVDFLWGESSVATGLPSDHFSARWTRTIDFQGGTYRFSVRSDDGVRVWLDGQRIIDQWHDTSSTTYTSDRVLTAGSYMLSVEYFDNTGDAEIQFWWERADHFPQWRGEYFSRMDLTGVPALVRNDEEIRFDWGLDGPSDGMPTDRFSGRWTRVMPFAEGIYDFRAVVDDGVRLYVDGVLVIDAWEDGSQRELTQGHNLAEGDHSLRVEYYENTGRASFTLSWALQGSYPDWKGEYWSNRELQGSPELARDDSQVRFDWGHDSPASGLPEDRFSARWTRTMPFEDASYRFHIVVDDGARLYIDDVLVIDVWADGSRREVTADRSLSEGNHALRIEYYDHTGEAYIDFWWDRLTTYPGWIGEYWPNRHLSGSPTMTRIDPAISFDWGFEAPGDDVPADDFSVRWTRPMSFDPGVYRFYTHIDDGVLLYVDGNLVLDQWDSKSGEEVYTVDLALSGSHQLKVEYLERSVLARIEFWWEKVGIWP